MEIKLEYGKTGLKVNLPDQNIEKVLTMKPAEIIKNPVETLTEMLENPIESAPLSALAKGKKSACVVICDITRPVPNTIILPPVLKYLEASGIARENITILIATGIHRPNLGDELIYLVGEEIAANYRVENHYAKEKSQHTHLGQTSRGTDVYVDSRFIEADLKITTGFIEPHLMAGFSGGRKLICPGISSLETVRVMHGPKILEHPNSREGVLAGNPFHEEASEIARMAGVDFIVNVALDEQRNITGMFAGAPEATHSAGVAAVRQHVTDTIPAPVDVVITTSAGFPLDTTFYQSIKGMTAALPILKKGGTIILAAECQEGLGSPEFAQLVREAHDLDKFMKDIYRPDYFVVDQWQYEELVKVLRKVDVILIAGKLSAADKAAMVTTCVDSVEEAVEMCLKKYGDTCKIVVIPKGPYIMTQIAE